MKTKTKQKNSALFPASRSPQKVVRMERVRDLDTGEFGTVLKRNVQGSGKVKVKWDNRQRPTLIDADQLAKANPKQPRYQFAKHSFAPKHRNGDPKHELQIKSYLNPTHGVCSCGRFNLNVQLAKGATEFSAQQYLEKWFRDHVKLEKRAAFRKAAASQNPRRAAAKSPSRPAATAKQPSRSAAAKSPSGSKKNPQQKFSASTLAHLRKQFEAIDNANIVKHRAAFDKVFAGTSRPVLKQLAEAKIEWVSPLAKNALVARRNPGILETGANLAVILGGLEHVRRMLVKKRKAKKKVQNFKTSPRANNRAKASTKKPNFGLISLAENLQAADFLRKALSSKKKKNAKSVTSRRAKPNPNNGRIFQEFTGSPSTKITNGFFIPKSEPTNIDQLGTLTEIKLGNLDRGPILRFPLGTRRVNGKRQMVFSNSLIDERGKAIKPERIHRLPNPSILCAKELGNGRRRFVVALKQPFILPNGAHEKKVHNYGIAVQVSYRAPKPHLYEGDTRSYEHYHNLGEEGGQQPQLKLDNGWFRFHGGDYKIREEGIRD